MKMEQLKEIDIEVGVVAISIDGFTVNVEDKAEDDNMDYEFLFKRAAVMLERVGLWDHFCEMYDIKDE